MAGSWLVISLPLTNTTPKHTHMRETQQIHFCSRSMEPTPRVCPRTVGWNTHGLISLEGLRPLLAVNAHAQAVPAVRLTCCRDSTQTKTRLFLLAFNKSENYRQSCRCVCAITWRSASAHRRMKGCLSKWRGSATGRSRYAEPCSSCCSGCSPRSRDTTLRPRMSFISQHYSYWWLSFTGALAHRGPLAWWIPSAACSRRSTRCDPRNEHRPGTDNPCWNPGEEPGTRSPFRRRRPRTGSLCCRSADTAADILQQQSPHPPEADKSSRWHFLSSATTIISGRSTDLTPANQDAARSLLQLFYLDRRVGGHRAMVGQAVPQQTQQGVIKLGGNARHVHQRWNLRKAVEQKQRLKIATARGVKGDGFQLKVTCPVECAWPS